MIPAAIQANVVLFGVQPSHRPPTAADNNQGTPARLSRQSSVPATFARRASTGRPRTKWAQDVIIPQVGHRMPNTTENVHGGSRNCWCVPRPRLSGSRELATASGHNKPNANAAAKSRSRPASLA